MSICIIILSFLSIFCIFFWQILLKYDMIRMVDVMCEHCTFLTQKGIHIGQETPYGK